MSQPKSRPSWPRFRSPTGGRLALPTVFAVVAWLTPAPAPASTLADICTSGPTFNLQTATGYASTPDGNSVFMWSYAPSPGDFQMPGPILCVTQGQTVTVNLTNNLPEPVSIVFPGQSGATATGGAAGLFTREAPASGGTVSYSFIAGQPGTYLYESGTNPHKQVEMGLYGALVVRPTMGANFAYNNAATQFNPAQEYLLILHEIDPFLHEAVERGENFDATMIRDRYFTVNGRAFPDTIQENNVPWLPGQPYGSLVTVEATTCATPGTGCSSAALPALIRYANAGLANHPFHPHGNHLRVIARDGRLLRGPANQDVSMEAFTKTIGSGQTYDLLVRWVNEQEFAPSPPEKNIPITMPGSQNLVFKDNTTWFSGSPYLGFKDDLPPVVTSYNDCGEFYFPWHSHALNEFVNFDEGFGGMATLWRVEPTDGCP